MQKVSQFDADFAQEYVRVRQAFTREFLESVRTQIAIESAADVGCGVGYFTRLLSEMGFDVVGLDGRDENVAEAKRRHPAVPFITRNVEDQALLQVGTFDYVLCYGLLYHLENPFQAIRNLHSLTGKLLMVETMCVPGTNANLELLDEYEAENQGLNYVAFYPTESCVVKMLYQAGFPFVYRFKQLRLDSQYATTLWRKRSRTILAASKIELTAPTLELAEEPVRLATGPHDSWSTIPSRIRDFSNSKWNIWTEKIFNVRVIAAGLIRRWRRPAHSLSSEAKAQTIDPRASRNG